MSVLPLGHQPFTLPDILDQRVHLVRQRAVVHAAEVADFIHQQQFLGVLTASQYTSRMRITLLAAVLLLSPVFAFAESAAGLQWTAPPGWKNAGPSPMRAATYSMPPAAGDTAPSECGVYFFGAGQGGSVEANLERWKSQFSDAAGKPPVAKTGTRKINGLTVTTIDTHGTYSGLGGPFAAGKPAPGYRLLGASVEGPGGNIFLKFAGPEKTVAGNQQKFEQLLASMKRS